MSLIICGTIMIPWLIQVNQVSGRVYILKFNTDDRKLFFWMQVRLIFCVFHLLICNIDFAVCCMILEHFVYHACRSQKLKRTHNYVVLSTIISIFH